MHAASYTILTDMTARRPDRSEPGSAAPDRRGEVL